MTHFRGIPDNDSHRGGLELKKGPWTTTEDTILADYVRKHGEGNWNALQRNSGLMRCGKSCRLRWANHLRPNLKKGTFSSEEERIIIELHAKLGNKWARMASQLPGRTDNEIKNFWNTRMKRRQRAGLPLYPQDVQDQVAAFHQQQHRQQQHRQTKRPAGSSPMSSMLSSSTQPRKRSYSPSAFSFIDPTRPAANPLRTHHPFTSSINYSPSNNQFKLYSDHTAVNSSNAGFALSLSPVSPYGSPLSPTLYNTQNFASHSISAPSFQFINSGNLDSEMSFSSLLMEGAQMEPFSFVSGLGPELPSYQTPTAEALTPASSDTSGGAYWMAPSSGSTSNDQYEIDTDLGSAANGTGLLDDLLQESKALSRHEKSKGYCSDSSMITDKGKGVVVDPSTEELQEEEEEHDNGGLDSVLSLRISSSKPNYLENQWGHEQNSSPSSIGTKVMYSDPPAAAAAAEELSSMDDDLLSLLNNFPSSSPLPDWYLGSKNSSEGSSSGMTAGSSSTKVVDAQNNMETSNTAAAPQLDWTLGSCYWNNMPGIC